MTDKNFSRAELEEALEDLQDIVEAFPSQTLPPSKFRAVHEDSCAIAVELVKRELDRLKRGEPVQGSYSPYPATGSTYTPGVSVVNVPALSGIPPVVTREQARAARAKALEHLQGAEKEIVGHARQKAQLALAKGYTRLYDADLWYLTENGQG